MFSPFSLLILEAGNHINQQLVKLSVFGPICFWLWWFVTPEQLIFWLISRIRIPFLYCPEQRTSEKQLIAQGVSDFLCRRPLCQARFQNEPRWKKRRGSCSVCYTDPETNSNITWKASPQKERISWTNHPGTQVLWLLVSGRVQIPLPIPYTFSTMPCIDPIGFMVLFNSK